MRSPHPLLLAWSAAALFGVGAATAQVDLDALRAQLSERIGSSASLRDLSTLVVAADEFELGGAMYRFANDSDTELSVIALPFSGSFEVFDEPAAPDLYWEVVGGYATERDQVTTGADSLDIRTNSIAGLVGVGLEFELADGLTLTPIGNVGLARLENDTRYAGPNAATLRAVADGIAFNWEALTLNTGAAARLAYDTRFGTDDVYRLQTALRYDLRFSETIESDDPAQDVSGRQQLLTLRADVTGPTGFGLFERDVSWRTTFAARDFLQSDLFGTSEIFSIGGALEANVADLLGLSDGNLSLGGSLLFGEDLVGWTLGGSLRF